MFYLFTESTGPNPKVKDSDFRDYYPNISHEMSWKNLKPFIRQAWHTCVKPFIGDDLMDELTTNLQQVTPDADKSELAELVKQTLALYAINLGYPELITHISDGSVTSPSPDSATPITKWQYDSARWNLILKAEKSLDVALAFLIEKSITPWTAGVEYQTKWFSGAKELQKYIKINGHRAYVAMLPYIKYAEQELSSTLTCDVMDDIVTNQSLPTYSSIIDHVKSYIAHKTLIRTIPTMLTYVEGNSLLFIQNAEGLTNQSTVYAKPNQDAIKMLIDVSLQNAADDIRSIRSVMESDPDTFTVYADYLESNTTSRMVIESCDGIGGIMIT